MGAADLREAFNSIAAPAFQCSVATLGYERAGGSEFQRLTFSGNRQDGNAFEVQSELLRAGSDVNSEARAVAQKLVDDPPPMA